MKNISIVGGGACGVAVFIELFLELSAHKLLDQTKITWIEKNNRIGYGLAFGTDQLGHLLNTQADLMGVYADEPGHFADWLKKNEGKNSDLVKGKGDTGDAYTARKLYGDYLAAQADEYLYKAQRSGFQVDVVHTEIRDMEYKNGKYLLVGAGGELIETDYTILTLGTPKPNNFRNLLKYDTYIDFPWPSEKILQRLGGKQHIGILGSSLSAIDAIMTLIDNGYEGKISLYSPDGLLPRVQPIDNKTINRKFLTTENLHQIRRKNLQNPTVKEVYRLYQKEVENITGPINWKSQNREGKNAYHLLVDDIRWAEKEGDILMNVVVSLRYEEAKIWAGFSIEEKIRFMKWLGPHWAINRNGMPLHNAYRLQALFEEKRLKVVPFFEDVRYDSGDQKFKMQIKDAGTQSVCMLINATGTPSPLKEMESELIGNMLKKELLKAHPIGGAVVNDRTMQLISPKGGNGIFALGHLLNGMLLDVNAVWFNVRTAATLCQEITYKLRNGDIS